jgi:hypothetical protein
MAEFPDKNVTGGGGWECAYCGAWVPNGVTHSCLSATYPGTTYTYPPYIDNGQLKRIADALEKLVELLEQRNHA